MSYSTGNDSANEVLNFWFGRAGESAEAAKAQNLLWFRKSDDTDQEITTRFLPLLTRLSEGEAQQWADTSPLVRLAVIIVLDQFSRNIFRNDKRAFAFDELALKLAKDGLSAGEDKSLREVERIFFYLPLEHSENLPDQTQCVGLFTDLAAASRPEFVELTASTLDYAHQHKVVIDRFGRFPHRNDVLGRASTPEELEYLSQPGSGF